MTQQNEEYQEEDLTQAGNVKTKIDLSNKRKRKGHFKRDVYKNVDLEKLNDFMTSDNFLI